MRIPMYRFARLLLVLTSGAVLAPTAWAQDGSSVVGSGLANKLGHGSDDKAPRRAEPSALPGAQSRPRAVAPLLKPPSEMGPTEALFDAVNRGDVAAARDAVRRGAEMNGHNLLGLTPLELAIDLSHNDIAFLLLSLRGTEALGKGGAATARSAAATGSGTPPAPRPAPVAIGRSSAATKATPARQIGADGGSPNPNAGFLGFNTGR